MAAMALRHWSARGREVRKEMNIVVDSTCVLPLVHPLGADLDLGTDEVAVEELPVLDPVELSNLLAGDRVVHLARLLPTLLLEGHLTKMSDGCCELEGVVLLLGAEAEGVEGHISELQLLSIINGVNLDLSLRKAAKRVLGIEELRIEREGVSQEVVVGVGAHEHEILEALHNALLNQLEENVVASEH